MGFHFRKSIKFGPLRINFSKSGVGFSTGVKGARISTGPKGTFIHLGSNGVYYRKKISDNPGESFTASSSKKESQRTSSETFDPNNFADSTNADLILEINKRITEGSSAGNISNLSILLTLVSLIVSAFIFSSTVETMPFEISFLLCSIPLLIALSSVVVGSSLVHKHVQQEQLERVTEVIYKLDELGQENLEVLSKAFKLLSEVNIRWHIVATKDIEAYSFESASSLVSRRSINLSKKTPPFIRTNIEPYCLSPINQYELYFLPDQVLVFSSGKYTTIPYNQLDITYKEIRFLETESCPKDTEVISYIWEHQRVDGGPDLRYRVNNRIPLVKYGEILLSFNKMFSIKIQVSNSYTALRFTQVFADYVYSIRYPGKRIFFKEARTNFYSNKEPEKRTETKKSKSPYEVLNIPPNATLEEIRTAYREQIQKYHPDKVAHLGPDLIRLAEERSREIIEAYDKLKSLQK